MSRPWHEGMLAEMMEDKDIPDTVPAPASTKCPCGTGEEYTACCGVLHAASAAGAASGGGGASPEAVMRARFSAYVKNLPAFVVDTTHPESSNIPVKVGQGTRVPRSQCVSEASEEDAASAYTGTLVHTGTP